MLRTGHRIAAGLVVAGAALTAAGTAQAATIVAEGAQLAYVAAPGERNALIMGGYAGGRVRFDDSQAGISAFPGGCEAVDATAVTCPVPAGVRVELGDGDDSFSLFDGMPAIPLTVAAGDGADELSGHTQPVAKTFDGGPGNDILRGLQGDDVLRGGAGDDVLHGDEGDDALYGEDGNDQLKPDNGKAPGDDVVDGGAGVDFVDDWVETASSTPPPVTISLDGVANDGRPGERDNVVAVERSDSYVSGTWVLADAAEEWHVFANVGGGPSTIHAGGGDDTITGEDEEETIDGGPGDDRLEGGRRADTLIGGPGRDQLLGDESDTGCTDAPEYCIIFGNDTIRAQDGERDEIDCGPGEDRAEVDPIDVHVACEEVVVAGRGPDGSGSAARLAFTRVRLGRALRAGLVVRVRRAQPGRIKATLRRKGKRVAAGSARASAAGKATIRLRFARPARRALKGKRSARFTLAAAGARRTITLRR